MIKPNCALPDVSTAYNSKLSSLVEDLKHNSRCVQFAWTIYPGVGILLLDLLMFDESSRVWSCQQPPATSFNVIARKLAQKFWLYPKLGKSTKELRSSECGFI